MGATLDTVAMLDDVSATCGKRRRSRLAFCCGKRRRLFRTQDTTVDVNGGTHTTMESNTIMRVFIPLQCGAQKACGGAESAQTSPLEISQPLLEEISPPPLPLPLVRVSQSRIPEAGLGLFAVQPLRRGQRVTRYFSECPLDRDAALKLRAEGNDTHVVALDLPHLYLDGRATPRNHPTELASFANHSALPNCKFKRKWNARLARNEVWMVAVRDVAAGVELTVSYGNDYWHVDRNKCAQ